MDMIQLIENSLGKKAQIVMDKVQLEDMKKHMLISVQNKKTNYFQKHQLKRSNL